MSGSGTLEPRSAVPAARRAVLAAGAALLGVLPAACGPGRDGAAAQTYKGEAITIRVQGGVGTSGGTGDHWDEVMAELRGKFPNINATWEPNPPTVGGVNWQTQVRTAMIGGTAPDIFGPWGYHFETIRQIGQLVNVGQFTRRVKQSDINDFAKWQWDAFANFEGDFRVGLPRYINIIVLYYNRDLFDQAGVRYPTANWTMDDYRDALARLSRDTDGDGRRDQWGGKLSYGAWDRFMRYPISWGGHAVDPKDRTKCLLGEPPAQQALQWLYDRIWRDNTMAQLQQLREAVNDTGNYIGFYRKKIALSEEGISGIGRTWAVEIQKVGGFNWSIAHVPKGPAVRNTLGTTDGWGMWAGSKNQAAAWEVMWYLAGPTFQRFNTIYQGQMPVRLSIQEDYKKILRQQWPTLEKVDLDVALEAQKIGYPRDDERFVDQPKAEELLIPALQRVFNEGVESVGIFKEVARQVTENQPRKR